MTSVYRATRGPSKLPRAVRKRDAASSFVWLIGLFILPHMLAGVVMVGNVMVSTANALAGADAQGRVVRTRIGPGGRGGQLHHVEYSYPSARGELTGQRSFSLKATSIPQVDQMIHIRHIDVGTMHESVMLLPGESAWDGAFEKLFIMLFWNGVLSFFFYSIWYVPLRNRRLYRWGTVAAGHITRKYEKKGRSTEYHVDYEFSTGLSASRSASMVVSSKTIWDRVNLGQPVTVLHDPKGPSPSVAYECGDYEWAEAED